MTDFSKAIQTLEFSKIRSMLADCALTFGAKKMAEEAYPDSDCSHVAELLKQTTDAKALIAQNGNPPISSTPEVKEIVEKSEKGAMLPPAELLDIASLLYTTNSLVAYSKIKNSNLGSLTDYFSCLVTNSALEHEIKRCIINADTIADDASPELANIRRLIKVTNNRIRETLQKYITAESTTKYLQENIVTIRDGRYVIPVKAENKNEIKGLIHDTSSTGATLFVEPLSVVEANNDLRRLESDEKKEVEKILYRLSSAVADFGHCIKLDYDSITEIAYIFARAEFSWRINGNEPIISESGDIELFAARHPLISKDKVVPIDIRLGKDFDTLIITGPNTGGKTVSLKTLGLLTLMAQTGLHIPARENSKLRTFDKILADIGDEQSIEQSLSTFSAHITNIVNILDTADSKSLILIDELGAGTDPVEGAALAVAITEKIRETGALVAITTHYSEMKIYALETDRVCNAACEFDINTLAPTYKLLIGTPGKSNAFAISRKIGLSDEIIGRAEKLIDPSNKKFENVIEKLEVSRIESEKLLESSKEKKAEWEKKRAEEEEYLQEKIAEADKIKEKSAEQATRIIESARATSEYVLAELDRVKKAKESEDFAKTLNQAKSNIKKSLNETIEKIDPVVSHVPENYVLPRHVKVGDEVIIISLGSKGHVTASADKNGNVTVSTGIMTTRVKESNLMLAEDDRLSASKKEKKKSASASPALSITKEFSSEIDLRGKNGDEAWLDVDKYLDSAQLAGVKTVRLIHGKGTGALKKRLWEFLKTDKRIKTYRIGSFGEGDLGVTVCELK